MTPQEELQQARAKAAKTATAITTGQLARVDSDALKQLAETHLDLEKDASHRHMMSNVWLHRFAAFWLDMYMLDAQGRTIDDMPRIIARFEETMLDGYWFNESQDLDGVDIEATYAKADELERKAWEIWE